MFFVDWLFPLKIKVFLTEPNNLSCLSLFENAREISKNIEVYYQPRLKMSGESVEAAINATLQNATAKNATLSGRAAATPQGLLTAYSSLVIMALLPIFFGSFRSIGVKKRQRVWSVYTIPL